MNPPEAKQILGGFGATLSVEFCCIQDGDPVDPPPFGSNNIDEDPLFADPSAQDFHLSAGSPAIDAGNDASIASIGDLADLDMDGDIAESIPLDFDWRLRVLEAGVDMGPFETGAVSDVFAYFCHAGKLLASDGTEFDKFGSSVSVHNGVAVVGASNADEFVDTGAG